MQLFNSLFRRSEQELSESGTVNYTYDAFKPGEQFPPQNSIERIAKYRRLKELYKSPRNEVFQRAISILKNTPHEAQLEQLYIAVNIAQLLAIKPADMLVGEKPIFDSGLSDETDQQIAINAYVEENDLQQLIHESAVSNGYRGDAWIKQRFDFRQDYSSLDTLGLPRPDNARMEPIIEHVAADCVFPITSDGNVKSFKEVIIANVEWFVSEKTDTPYLNVERHLPGFIIYERYLLSQYEGGVNNDYGYAVNLFKIEKRVSERNVVETKVPNILVQHIPFNSIDDQWQGTGTLETIENLLYAINDRITQIDYVLWKHTDPIMYGPKIDGPIMHAGGRYVETTKDDVTPGYMTWDSELQGAFKELETLVAMVFQIAETPQWLFGTVLGDQNAGGTGTSHTDGAAIRARFLPILSKVSRIRVHYDKGLRDALYNCQLLDNAHNPDVSYDPVYPTIHWSDGLPKNEKEEAEIMEIRLGGKPSIDQATAIKRMDGLDDIQAQTMLSAIEKDDTRATGTVESSIFNEEA